LRGDKGKKKAARSLQKKGAKLRSVLTTTEQYLRNSANKISVSTGAHPGRRGREINGIGDDPTTIGTDVPPRGGGLWGLLLQKVPRTQGIQILLNHLGFWGGRQKGEKTAERQRSFSLLEGKGSRGKNFDGLGQRKDVPKVFGGNHKHSL